jgi:hypothetical protein
MSVTLDDQGGPVADTDNHTGITTREALQLYFSFGALAARTSGSSLPAVSGEVLEDLVC